MEDEYSLTGDHNQLRLNSAAPHFFRVGITQNNDGFISMNEVVMRNNL